MSRASDLSTLPLFGDPPPPPSPVVRRRPVSTAAERRDRGAERVSFRAPSEFVLLVDRMIGVLAAAGRDFTAEDLRELVGDPPADVHPNVLPARFVRAAQKRTIVWTGGTVRGRRPVSHARLLRVWRGGA